MNMLKSFFGLAKWMIRVHDSGHTVQFNNNEHTNFVDFCGCKQQKTGREEKKRKERKKTLTKSAYVSARKLNQMIVSPPFAFYSL